MTLFSFDISYTGVSNKQEGQRCQYRNNQLVDPVCNKNRETTIEYTLFWDLKSLKFTKWVNFFNSIWPKMSDLAQKLMKVFETLKKSVSWVQGWQLFPHRFLFHRCLIATTAIAPWVLLKRMLPCLQISDLEVMSIFYTVYAHHTVFQNAKIVCVKILIARLHNGTSPSNRLLHLYCLWLGKMLFTSNIECGCRVLIRLDHSWCIKSEDQQKICRKVSHHCHDTGSSDDIS